MRLSKLMIESMAKTIADKLVEEGFAELLKEKSDLSARIKYIITEDLMQEDKLNDEVKEIMRTYSAEIAKGEVDYGKMFKMIKAKLAKEKGMVL